MNLIDSSQIPLNLVERWALEHLPADAPHGTAETSKIDAAISAGLTSGDDVARWWAAQLNLEAWNGTVDARQATRLAERVPFEFAMDHLVLLLAQSETHVRCLSARPWRWQAIDNLSVHVNVQIRLEVGPESLVRDTIGRIYDRRMSESGAVERASITPSTAAQQTASSVDQAMAELQDRDLLASHGKEPVAKLVDALLYEATQKRASDLHVHPYPNHLKIRYRLNGVLHDSYQLSRSVHDQIVGRIKVLAGMDVAEKRLAQDGRTSVQIGARQIDLRVSTLPTTCGERVVVRLLEQTSKLRELSELGMPADVEVSFRDAIQRSTGLILVTGPTGSGKTTTLYSALAQLDATAKNILTLEDPVEYRLAGISQTPISEKKGMTFLSGLRHILRQDPDVVMVGEIRDEATARMVIQSSLTGHLVLSTLHTNSAAGAVARLMDLKIEPFLIASSLVGVLAQRLVRTCCCDCAGSAPTHCSKCDGTGYEGRLALFEWMGTNSAVREAITAGSTAERIESIAVTHGMRTLRAQGNAAVASRTTTETELLRVLGSEEE